MKKLFINNRDEMVIINLEHVAYVIADGNCITLQYILGAKRLLSIGISKFYSMIVQAYNSSPSCPFVKLGRSVIINQHYLYDIHLLKQTIVLSDDEHTYQVKVSKSLLKSYKEMIVKLQKPTTSE